MEQPGDRAQRIKSLGKEPKVTGNILMLSASISVLPVKSYWRHTSNIQCARRHTLQNTYVLNSNGSKKQGSKNKAGLMFAAIINKKSGSRCTGRANYLANKKPNLWAQYF